MARAACPYCRGPGVDSIQGVRQEVIDAIDKARHNCLNDTNLSIGQRKKVGGSVARNAQAAMTAWPGRALPQDSQYTV